MFRKIDCVMIRVPDVPAAASFYEDAFGLKRLWQDNESIGLGMSETDAEIVLHNSPDIPHDVEVHYLVDSVAEAVKGYVQKGCTLLVEPFEIVIGQCAVIRDPFSTTLCLLDMTKGPREIKNG